MKLSELVQLSTDIGSVEVEIIDAPGRTMFATKELIQSLTRATGRPLDMNGAHPIKQLLFKQWGVLGLRKGICADALRETFWAILSSAARNRKLSPSGIMHDLRRGKLIFFPASL